MTSFVLIFAYCDTTSKHYAVIRVGNSVGQQQAGAERSLALRFIVVVEVAVAPNLCLEKKNHRLQQRRFAAAAALLAASFALRPFFDLIII